MRNIRIYFILLIGFITIGAVVYSYPQSIAQPIPAGGETFYVSPSKSTYQFVVQANSTADVITMRVTPLNTDPELQFYCKNTKMCEFDLSDYTFDTSVDYAIFGGSEHEGFLLFE